VTDRAHAVIALMSRGAASDAAYLGWVFERYAASEGMAGTHVCEALLVDAQTFAGLSLCLRPRPDHFAEDIRAIAAKYAVDLDALAAMVRRVDVVSEMRAGRSGGRERGQLMAARSRPARPDDADAGRPSDSDRADDGPETQATDEATGEDEA
jgi:hypothetical protein